MGGGIIILFFDLEAKLTNAHCLILSESLEVD